MIYEKKMIGPVLTCGSIYSLLNIPLDCLKTFFGHREIPEYKLGRNLAKAISDIYLQL